MKIVCTSGYFNPLHIGHVRLLKEAKALGDYLVVIVNNDEQVKLKGESKPFMNEKERVEIIKAIKYVDKVVLSIDKDRTIKKTLGRISPDIFAKGGDSTPENTPEKDLVKKVVYNVGGGKIQSSRWLKS